MTEIEGLFEEAEEWIFRRINKEDLGKYYIIWDGIFVVFTKKVRKLRDCDILDVINNSSDIVKAWKENSKSPYINIQYYGSILEIIHSDEVVKEDWFKRSLSWMISCGLVFEESTDIVLARYHPLYSYQSEMNYTLAKD